MAKPEPEPSPEVKIKKLTVKKGHKLKVTLKAKDTSAITGYEISYRIKGSSKWKTAKLAASKTTKTLTKLKKGKRYQVRVRWYQKVGDIVVPGDWSKIKTSNKIK